MLISESTSLADDANENTYRAAISTPSSNCTCAGARHPVINEHVVMHKNQTGAARRLVSCANMLAHPVRERLLTQLFGRQFEYLDDTVSIVRLEVPPIELEEQLDRNELSTLVAVNKGVIAGEAVAIRGG